MLCQSLFARTVAAAVVGATMLAGRSAAQNFQTSCETDSIVVSGPYIEAICPNILGNEVCSKLNLSTCIKNVHGSLQADPTGAGPHFNASCINCSNSGTTSGIIITNSPTILVCNCDPGTGVAQNSWPQAIIDLSTIVDNYNGILACNDDSVKGQKLC